MPDFIVNRNLKISFKCAALFSITHYTSNNVFCVEHVVRFSSPDISEKLLFEQASQVEDNLRCPADFFSNFIPICAVYEPFSRRFSLIATAPAAS